MRTPIWQSSLGGNSLGPSGILAKDVAGKGVYSIVERR